MADSDKNLLELERKANKLKISTCLISDRGLTELNPGTLTALGIGPGPSSLINMRETKGFPG